MDEKLKGYLKYLDVIRDRLMHIDDVFVEGLICATTPKSIPEALYNNINLVEDSVINLVEQLDYFIEQVKRNIENNSNHK